MRAHPGLLPVLSFAACSSEPASATPAPVLDSSEVYGLFGVVIGGTRLPCGAYRPK